MSMAGLEDALSSYAPKALSLFRIVIGFFFTLHGTQKLFAWPSDGDAPVPVGAWPIWYAGLIELVVGILVMVGLFTRVAAFVGSGEMAFAYFMRAQPRGLLPIQNNGELSATFSFAFLLLVFAGGGLYALDTVRRQRHSRTDAARGPTN